MAAKTVKCQECVDSGQRSKVYGGDICSRTLMGYHSYYDEDGARHSHDPNISSYFFRCSNGHTWQKKVTTPCPAPDCEWNKRHGSAG